MDVRKYLKIKKMTVHEFAEKFGLALRSVYRYRECEGAPGVQTARKLEELSGGEMTFAELRKKAKY